MKNQPDWLPSLISVSGPIDKVIPQLYAIFHHDIVLGKPELRDSPLCWDSRPKELFGFKYDEGFWHLITRVRYVWTSTGCKEDRDFDPPRAERLPWFAPTIKHADSNEVLVWDYLEKGRKLRTYVWLYEWDYVIVLQPKKLRIGSVYFIVTAYHIDGDATRATLKRKYEKRCE